MASAVYRWTDAAGIVHADDNPPPDGTYVVLYNVQGTLVIDRVSTPESRAQDAKRAQEKADEEAHNQNVHDCNNAADLDQRDINDLSRQYQQSVDDFQEANSHFLETQHNLTDAMDRLNELRGYGHYGSVLIGGAIAAFGIVEFTGALIEGELAAGLVPTLKTGASGVAGVANDLLDGEGPGEGVVTTGGQVLARLFGDAELGGPFAATDLVLAGKKALEFPEVVTPGVENIPMNLSDLFSVARGKYQLAEASYKDAADELSKKRRDMLAKQKKLEKAKADAAAKYGACIKQR